MAASSPSPMYAVSDVHGHLTELRHALLDAGLVDAADRWTGGAAVLWVLGDFLDRGPDGVGVIDLVRSLQQQAPDQGGRVAAVLGNHDVMALAVRKFGGQVVPGGTGRPRSFALAWTVNGGRLSDQQRLCDERAAWLAALPAMAVDGGWLLVHSDTRSYLHYGRTVDAVNQAVRDVLDGDELTEWWELFRRLTERHAYRGRDGGALARHMLATYGGERMVHGHSVLASLTGTPSAQVTGPLQYADRLVLGIDGGLYDGGPCLLTRLDRVPRP
ncbi:MAG TPA: metallophosphoesterase [Segeticoccus sp.]|uniref:metallophosphoesterase n=1 Tax=Segeticoccus sp. TaxID=2706531 RepID=UPI002D7FD106|nr:metallophosphoesterase [Segeticoccus sp.]HET8600333.1 metallophosphoesterase [Segeticoccus sp.]